ncbi:MAG TPA: calcium/sodium antiporter [Candidatus Paceibacterota bacterium]
MLISALLLIAGFALLVKGADSLVDGSVSIAKKHGIPNLVIGLTIVAFGTSAPELVVNLTSAFSGTTDLALGNIIGSNIANVFLILGVCALLYPLKVQRNTVWKEIPLSFIAALMVFVLANDASFAGFSVDGIGAIGAGDGIVLLCFFAIFLNYIFVLAKQGSDEEGMLAGEEEKKLTVGQSYVRAVGGLAALVVGGSWIVKGAVAFASSFGISESVIGLTIVAVGTSLPEFAASLAAVRKKQVDIAVGNVVGSNIFNIFWILGISALVSPMPLGPGSSVDLAFLLASSSLLFLFMFAGKRHALDRWQGALFLALYAFYIVFLVAL